jgi:hypothetical protein
MKTNSIIPFVCGGAFALAIVLLPKAFERSSGISAAPDSGQPVVSDASPRSMEASSFAPPTSTPGPQAPLTGYSRAAVTAASKPAVSWTGPSQAPVPSTSAPRRPEGGSAQARGQTASQPVKAAAGRSNASANWSGAASAAATGASEDSVNVPPGLPVPAAVAAIPDQTTSDQAVESLDAISDDFLDAVAGGSKATGATQTATPAPAAWRDATFEANERYRSIYGVEAFNRWTTEAAKQALMDR